MVVPGISLESFRQSVNQTWHEASLEVVGRVAESLVASHVDTGNYDLTVERGEVIDPHVAVKLDRDSRFPGPLAYDIRIGFTSSQRTDPHVVAERRWYGDSTRRFVTVHRLDSHDLEHSNLSMLGVFNGLLRAKALQTYGKTTGKIEPLPLPAQR